MPEKYILIIGNPIDGLNFYGPFSEIEAEELGASVLDADWWVVELLDQESLQNQIQEQREEDTED